MVGASVVASISITRPASIRYVVRTVSAPGYPISPSGDVVVNVTWLSE
jgi:hypothetical protein